MKKFLALLMAATIAFTAAGCGAIADVTDGTGEASDSTVDAYASKVDEEKTGEIVERTGAIGEMMRNEFFYMQVNEAHRMSSVSGYVPNDPNYEYLCVNVTVTSGSAETINVGTYDFDIVWGEGDDLQYDTAIEQEDFGFEKYPDSVDIEYREIVKGNVFFMIPKDAQNLRLQYLELFDNDSTGNCYRVELGNPEYMEDPSAPAGTNSVVAAPGEKYSTSAFDLTVNGVTAYNELAGYTLDEGYTFIGVDVTMEGTSAEPVDTGAYYFSVYWGATENDLCYALEDEGIPDFPINVTLAQGDKVEGEMFFVVPTTAEYVDFYYIDLFTEEIADYTVTLGAASSFTAAA